jgi:sulfonate transport system substrate-binding protein
MRQISLKLAVALAVLTAAGTAQAEPVKIRVAWIAPITNWASLLLEKKDLAKHMGTSYVLEPQRFQSTPLMITALAAGEIEIADLAFSTLPIAIQNAGMEDLRIIADEIQDGVPGYYSQEYMVLADGPIKKVEDLKGKIVASLGAGSAVDIAIRSMLKRHGLEPNRDYTVVEAGLPNMRAMLGEKKVDLVPVVLPFALDPELRKIAKPLFVHSDLAGVTQMLMWTARKPFLDKNRAAMVDFMEDCVRITNWFRDPANHKEAIEISSRIAKQPPERLDWAFTNRDYYHAENMKPDLVALQKNIEISREVGFVKGPLEVQKYADLSIIDEAIKRLK